MMNGFARNIWGWNIPLALLGSLLVTLCLSGIVVAQEQPASSDENQTWMEEIEKTFIPSEQCKQCHDRHYEEWKGMREQTMDLKTFGRVDGALLHGTALTSPVFQTVLGLWLQTKPEADERNRCLSCHVPAVTVFPQHTDRIIEQVMKGRKKIPTDTRRSKFLRVQRSLVLMPNRMRISFIRQSRLTSIRVRITVPPVTLEKSKM
jgi:hypothetical protein